MIPISYKKLDENSCEGIQITQDDWEEAFPLLLQPVNKMQGFPINERLIHELRKLERADTEEGEE